MAALASYEWPGNVRELRNVVERLVAVGELDSRVGERQVTPATIITSRDGSRSSASSANIASGSSSTATA